MRSHGILTLLVCIVAVLAVAGAGCTGTTQAGGDELKDSYIVGIDGSYAPFSYVDKDGNAQGFDVDSMRWIAEKKGINVTFKAIDWDAIIPSLQAGKIDMVYAGMTITPERLEAVNFSNPYWTVNQDVAVREDSNVTLDDVLAGKAVLGAQRGCTAATWIEKNLIETGKMPAANLKLYVDTPAAVSDLEIGRIDAVMYDDLSLGSYIEGKPLKIIGSVETKEQFGVAIRKEDTALLEFMNEALAELQADPYWEELKEKYNLN
ncbi:ABC transporter substrate-binding protein [Methanoculleus thermophilus]|jgi:polar amino acid transport system substrate-binding protein|uniref:Amino acid ABC transporter substrate-binding protein, PAAT family n=2 Tax=Methanoculleus thermophilus TaxID=2200 RepID=A0A1G9AE72_9EURY|nr:ABC transporter substrate-binding protein [Methanoculleus thermophilus]SDK25692.1 amino acid ABC transporter substrate-binding protein, PAAT family [Methanoculleus thermophilus]HQD26193.1 ABC transporter substrate-binding protein [Methanoculleus thermophilus]